MSGRSGYRYRTRWIAWSFIAAAAICCAYAAASRGGAAEWFGLTLLVAVMLISGVMPFAAAAGIRAERSLGMSAVSAGGNAPVRIKVKRAWPLPFVWLAVQERVVNGNGLSGDAVHFSTVLTPTGRRETAIGFSLCGLERGVYRFEPLQVTVGDWLGLTAVHKTLQLPQELTVLPDVPEDEPAVEAAASGWRRSAGSDAYASPLAADRREAGNEWADVAIPSAMSTGGGPDRRPYREGDSLRSIDFRAAARGLGLYTKLQPTGRAAAQAVIAVDSTALPYGGDARLFDECIGRALQDALRCGRSGSEVVCVSGEWVYSLCAAGEGVSEQRFAELLHLTARLRADDGMKLESLLLQAGLPLGQGATVRIYTGDWRDCKRWEELAGPLMEDGCRLELLLAASQAPPTFAMRENFKVLEGAGVKAAWLPIPERRAAASFAQEGANAHALG